MAQDLREMFEKDRKSEKFAMKKGHESRFMSKLEQELPKTLSEKRSSVFFRWQIAASLIVLVGLGIYFLSGEGGIDPIGNSLENVNVLETKRTISLGDLSPDLKKIESYYVTNINLQLSDLEFNTDNKALVDGYMLQLAELDAEYNRLNTELNEIGPNDDTISALITNLQLRLQLLQKLKTKLNQLKSSKNEQKPSNIV